MISRLDVVDVEHARSGVRTFVCNVLPLNQ